MGQRSGAPENSEDAAKLTLKELNDWISRAEVRVNHLNLSASLKKAAMKQLVWLETLRFQNVVRASAPLTARWFSGACGR